MSAQAQMPASVEEAFFAAACSRLDPRARTFLVHLIEEVLELQGQGADDEIVELLSDLHENLKAGRS